MFSPLEDIIGSKQADRKKEKAEIVGEKGRGEGARSEYQLTRKMLKILLLYSG